MPEASGRILALPRVRRYAWSIGVVAACSLVAWSLFPRLADANRVMTYLLGVVFVALRCGRGPSVLASILSVAAFDFFFIHPHLSLAVEDSQYLITFAVMLAVALIISTLTVRLREQVVAAQESEKQSAALHALSQELADAASRSQVQAETEQMRSALLSAVSHDLRTPLATITGSASLLLERGATDEGREPGMDADQRRELLSAIYDESERLNRLVGNLLEMTRLESGHGQVRREWHSLEEIVGAALGRVERALAGREVTTSVPADLPLVDVDGLLIELVLINLLENAAKHTPPGTPIVLEARASDRAMVITVADRGPGVGAAELERVFERFHRGAGAAVGGSGLGLAVCAGIVAAHGGRIDARNRDDGGLEVRVALPVTGEAPGAPADAGGGAA